MKLRLTRLLYDRGRGRDYVINLLKVIDWALVIPKDLELEYKEKLHELEEEKNMSYVTSFEKSAIEKGLQQGLQQGREEGREEGEYLKATIIAKKLIAQGRSIQYIQDLTNLPENEIINLFELEKA